MPEKSKKAHASEDDGPFGFLIATSLAVLSSRAQYFGYVVGDEQPPTTVSVGAFHELRQQGERNTHVEPLLRPI